MKLYPASSWTVEVFTHSYRFWFYALFLSLVLEIWVFVLSFVAKTSTSSKIRDYSNEKQQRHGSKKAPERVQLSVFLTARRIFITGCDLLIPGSFLGWIAADSLQVGIATLLSTILTIGDIWANIQRQ